MVNEDETESDATKHLKEIKQQKVGNKDTSKQSSDKAGKKNKKKHIDYSRDEEAPYNKQVTNNETGDLQIEEEVEWTDTDSEAGSDVSLQNYKIESNSDINFSDSRLRKITNPQMVRKVQQYLSLRNAINNESENPSSRRKSLMLQAKRNKRNFKSLQKEIQIYIDVQDWYR